MWDCIGLIKNFISDLRNNEALWEGMSMAMTLCYLCRRKGAPAATQECVGGDGLGHR